MLTPAMITTRRTSKSFPILNTFEDKLGFVQNITPAKLASILDEIYTIIFMVSTFNPLNWAAFSLLPIANICLPIIVCFNRI
jgi:hypothetical protein